MLQSRNRNLRTSKNQLRIINSDNVTFSRPLSERREEIRYYHPLQAIINNILPFSESEVWSIAWSSSVWPNNCENKYDLAQTIQWMGRDGVLRIVQTGNTFGFDFGVQSKHSVAFPTWTVAWPNKPAVPASTSGRPAAKHIRLTCRRASIERIKKKGKDHVDNDTVPRLSRAFMTKSNWRNQSTSNRGSVMILAW